MTRTVVERRGRKLGAGGVHRGEKTLGVGEPLGRVPARGLSDEVVEDHRKLRDLRGRRGQRTGDMLPGDVDGGVARDGGTTGEHLVEHEPDGVEVGAGVGRAVLDLLGREVGDGAEEGAGASGRGRRAHRAGEAEVGHLHVPLGRDEDVLGLDVAVQDVAAMGRAGALEDRGDEVERLARGEGALLLEEVAQGLPIDELHREEEETVVLTLVEHADDVRVRQPRRRPRLPAESPDELGVAGEIDAHDLEGDLSIEAGVEGRVDAAHAAVGEVGEHRVAPVDRSADESVLLHGRHGGSLGGPPTARPVRRAGARLWHSGSVNDQQPNDRTPSPDPRLADLETLVDGWLSVPEAAERQGCALSTVRTQLKNHELVAVRRGPNNAIYIPAVFVTPEGPLPALPGTITVLADGGMNDLELLTWLFTPQEGLVGDGSPMGALLAGHKSEIRRRAMETAF